MIPARDQNDPEYAYVTPIRSRVASRMCLYCKDFAKCVESEERGDIGSTFLQNQ
jgi:hypothetical protein